MSASRITCTRKLHFDAAHRLMQHEGKCRHLHGHGYVVEATFACSELDSVGRVVDFGIIKEKLGGWLNANWDHTTILWEKDAALAGAITDVTEQRVFLLPYNPTAENMARYLHETVCPSLFAAAGIRCTQIRIHETQNCYADAYTP
jgi:6-pyruvoyltetrahydropterin/6-carboxytetrahydropterin synthase